MNSLKLSFYLIISIQARLLNIPTFCHKISAFIYLYFMYFNIIYYTIHNTSMYKDNIGYLYN